MLIENSQDISAEFLFVYISNRFQLNIMVLVSFTMHRNSLLEIGENRL